MRPLSHLCVPGCPLFEGRFSYFVFCLFTFVFKFQLMNRECNTSFMCTIEWFNTSMQSPGLIMKNALLKPHCLSPPCPGSYFEYHCSTEMEARGSNNFCDVSLLFPSMSRSNAVSPAKLSDPPQPTLSPSVYLITPYSGPTSLLSAQVIILHVT